jgi:hypothetical protein
MIKLYPKQVLILIIALLYNVTINGQNHDHDHDHDHDHHDHPKNEIGVANSPVYFVKEKAISYGLHLHYVRTISDSKFGIGLGYERIFDEHEHHTIGVVTSYRPIHGLSLNVSPGITFEGNTDEEDHAGEEVHEDEEGHANEINFALHIESAYEWEFGNFHLGPVFEFAYDPEDYHISLGLHLGLGF